MQVSRRQFLNTAHARKAAITTRVVQLVHEVVSKRIHITKRDLFYTDVKLFKDQTESDAVLDDVACMLGCTRTSLHVVASDKVGYDAYLRCHHVVLMCIYVSLCTCVAGPGGGAHPVSGGRGPHRLHQVKSIKKTVELHSAYLSNHMNGTFTMISYTCRMGVGGKAIPPYVDRISGIRSDARFILLVEKEAAYMRLAEDR